LIKLLSFKAQYKESLHFGESSILEAEVVGRNEHVQVHAEITQATNELVSDIFFSDAASFKSLRWPGM